MSRPPKIFSAEANRELSRRLNRQCCWKIPKMFRGIVYCMYTLYDKICKINSVFEEITNLSGEWGPLTWYDGGSYINLGPCALLRQQRSEKFKYGKKDEICFNNDRQPSECRTQLRIQIKETENIIVSESTRVWKCFHPNLKSWGWEIFSIFAK